MKITSTSYPTKIMRIEDIDSSFIIGENVTLPKYADLIRSAQKLTVHRDTFDLEKIRSDFTLPDATDAVEWRGMKRLVALGKFGELLREITISMRTIRANYMMNVAETAYSFQSSVLAQWLDNFDIQEWFSEKLDVDIEDAGFYSIPVSVIQEFNQTFADTGVVLPEEDGVVYQEWYRD